MNRNSEDQWQCPFCKSIGTFEPTYLGAFPHVYQYTCTECGVSGPTGNGQTKKAAILDAKNEQIKFLNGYYELELANKELIKTINQYANVAAVNSIISELRDNGYRARDKERRGERRFQCLR
jgi:monomeric isocitrate dehydrogenase